MIAPTPFFADRGGHMRIYEEAKHLEQKGYSVTIATYHIGRDIGDLDIRRIPSFVNYNKLSAGPAYTKVLLDILLFFMVLNILRNERYSIIHAHLHEGVIIGYLPSRIFRIPLLFDSQDSLVAELISHNFIDNRLILLLFIFIEVLTIKISDQIIISSYHTKKFFQYLVPGVPVNVVLDGSNTKLFNQQVKAEGDQWKNPKNLCIGYLGGLQQHKGIDYFIDTLPYLPSGLNILIMGYPGEDRIRGLIDDMDIENEVIITGKIPYDKAPNYLQNLDVAIAPKIFDSGEVNGKLLNYMAMGLPIVCFDHHSNRQILGGVGIYAKYKNAKDLADKIISIVQDRQKQKIYGEQLAERAKSMFSWDNSADRIIEHYHSLLQ